MPAVHRDARPADYGVHIYVRARNLPVVIALAFDATRSGDKRRLKAVDTEKRDKQLVGKYLVVNVHWQCRFSYDRKGHTSISRSVR